MGNVGWYTSNSGGKTHEVGTKSSNLLGLFDMSGNVEEWCYDWYEKYGNTPLINPSGPIEGTERVCRGGHCEFQGTLPWTVFYRWQLEPSSKSACNGIRVVRSVFK